MTEFADLLKEAAGQPPRPLNMVTVRQRAARLGMRRRAGAWAGALLVTVSIGVPTGVALVPSEEHPTDLRTVEEQERPVPDAIVEPATPPGSPGDWTGADAPRRVAPNTTIAVTSTSVPPPPAGATVTTIVAGDPPESGDEDRCTRAGPIAAECGEAGATTCWATRVGCPSTTTTTTTTTRPRN